MSIFILAKRPLRFKMWVPVVVAHFQSGALLAEDPAANVLTKLRGSKP